MFTIMKTSALCVLVIGAAAAANKKRSLPSKTFFPFKVKDCVLYQGHYSNCECDTFHDHGDGIQECLIAEINRVTNEIKIVIINGREKQEVTRTFPYKDWGYFLSHRSPGKNSKKGDTAYDMEGFTYILQEDAKPEVNKRTKEITYVARCFQIDAPEVTPIDTQAGESSPKHEKNKVYDYEVPLNDIVKIDYTKIPKTNLLYRINCEDTVKLMRDTKQEVPQCGQDVINFATKVGRYLNPLAANLSNIKRAIRLHPFPEVTPVVKEPVVKKKGVQVLDRRRLSRNTSPQFRRLVEMMENMQI